MNAQTARLSRSARRLKTVITQQPDLVEYAQKLRYQVFSEEYGSDLGATVPGIDADEFDRFCDHLIVTDESTGELVATTRVLHHSQAVEAGGFYSEGEFELSPDSSTILIFQVNNDNTPGILPKIVSK